MKIIRAGYFAELWMTVSGSPKDFVNFLGQLPSVKRRRRRQYFWRSQIIEVSMISVDHRFRVTLMTPAAVVNLDEVTDLEKAEALQQVQSLQQEFFALVKVFEDKICK